ncbi:MAG: hypothetical protein ACRD4D_05445 [Candidatus Acidiferrales bacterium]
MKKLGIILVVVAVAAVAFVVGWQYRGTQAPPEAETVFNEPPPAVPPPAAEEPAAPAPAAAPRRRSAAPPTQSLAAEPAPTPASAPVTEPAPAVKEPVRIRLAEGTMIAFTLNNSLSTKTNRPGDEFSGVVSRSVRVGETIAIPEGSVVRGTVSHAERPGRVSGRGELGLRFDQLELPSGEVYQVSASLTDLGGEKETVGEEGEVKGEGTKKRDAATIGAGAGIGAVIGAISGGGKGAATGGAIGAGAGTGVVLLTRGKDVEIRRGAELAIQLDRPLSVVLP